MLTLRIVQALEGDCFVLDYGTAARPRHLLIDGGPSAVYDGYLRPVLAQIAGQGDRLDCVVLSHADNDHVIGLVDLFTELTQQKHQGQPPLIGVDSVWMNSFDLDGAPVPAAVFAPTLLPAAMAAPVLDADAVLPIPLEGVAEGMDVRRMVGDLGITRNAGFKRGEVSFDTAPGPVTLGNLTLRIIGPTESNLERLRREWKAWLQAHARAAEAFEPSAAADLRAKVQLDQSIPNRSSIMFLAEAGKKRILFTGDGRGDHITKGLVSAGLMAEGGTLHVDVLKMPHHGSARNISRAFFDQITADIYVFSADGQNGNPDLATLIWLVEAVKAQGRKVRLVMTNTTATVDQLKENYPPKVYGYRIEFIAAAEKAYILRLA
jgi:hypothetical protein